MALAPVFVELKATTTEFAAKMGEARHEVSKLSTEGAGHFHKLQEVGKAALFGVAGAGLAIGTMAVHAAIEGEAAHMRLAQAIKNAGGSMEEMEPQVNALSDRFAHLGFTNDEVETGLANMTTSLRDPEKAMKAMGLAADLARFKHISLADASVTVAKAMEGQLRPLKQLGIDLPVAAGGALKLEKAHTSLAQAQDKVNAILKQYPDAAEKASKHHAQYEAATQKVALAQAKLKDVQGASIEITQALAGAVGGQAATASQTFAGKLEAAKAQAENLVEKLGTQLLPVITSLIEKISETVQWFEKHRTTAEALAIVVGGALTAAITAYLAGLVVAAATSVASFATMVASAAAWAASMLVAGATALLPFLPLIAICAALALAAYELYKHWDTVWGGIKTAVSAAWSLIKPIFDAIVTVGLAYIRTELAVYAAVWNAVWTAVKTTVATAWSAIKAVFNTIVSGGIWYIKTEITILRSVWDAVWGAIHSVVSSTWGALKTIMSSIVSGGLWLIKREVQGLENIWNTAWDGIKSVVSGVWDYLKPIFDKIHAGLSGITGVVGKVGGIVGKIPGFATGTNYAPGGMAWVGENGPELVNLPRGSGVTPARQSAAMAGGGGGTTINVHVAGSVASATDLAEAIHTALLRKKQRGGSLGLA